MGGTGVARLALGVGAVPSPSCLRRRGKGGLSAWDARAKLTSIVDGPASASVAALFLLSGFLVQVLELGVSSGVNAALSVSFTVVIAGTILVAAFCGAALSVCVFRRAGVGRDTDCQPNTCLINFLALSLQNPDAEGTWKYSRVGAPCNSALERVTRRVLAIGLLLMSDPSR
eukprot:1640919-Amphidinium_carterae.1